MGIFEDIQKANAQKEDIVKSFFGNESTPELVKRIEGDIEKGGKPAMIGEVREFGGKKYHKTPKGWRPVPKGGIKSPEEKPEEKKEEKKATSSSSTRTIPGGDSDIDTSSMKIKSLMNLDAPAIEKILTPLKVSHRLKILDFLQKFVEKDQVKSPLYQELTQDKVQSVLSKIRTVRKSLIGVTTVTSSKGDKFVIDNKGKISLNDIPVVVDEEYAYVKFGGRGVEFVPRTFHHPSVEHDQLQGIMYRNIMLAFRNELLNGKSVEEAIAAIQNRPTGMHKETGSDVWPSIARHLKLK